MSLDYGRVISFRLAPDDPLEGRALAYLEREEAKRGKRKTRAIIAEALAGAGDKRDQMNQIIELQQRAVDILEKLQSGQVRIVDNGSDGDDPGQGSELSEATQAGLIALLKPIKRIEE